MIQKLGKLTREARKFVNPVYGRIDYIEACKSNRGKVIIYPAIALVGLSVLRGGLIGLGIGYLMFNREGIGAGGLVGLMISSTNEYVKTDYLINLFYTNPKEYERFKRKYYPDGPENTA